MFDLEVIVFLLKYSCDNFLHTVKTEDPTITLAVPRSSNKLSEWTSDRKRSGFAVGAWNELSNKYLQIHSYWEVFRASS
jgi:hypothetical protein